MRFSGIEGARAFLAWVVVLDHLSLISGATKLAPWAHHLVALGGLSVQVFIIISGFVICHLRLSREEPYGVYLLRRAARIYPAYIIGLVASALILPAFAASIWGSSWADPGIQTHVHAQTTALQDGLGPVHWVLHLGLLHGLVPSSLLPDSEYFFLTPGWSLSLEWQFYLVAPLLIFAMRSRLGTLAVLGVTAGLFAAYSAGLLGHFAQPSVLPAALPLFLVGIGSRLMFEQLERQPRVLVGLAAAAAASSVIYESAAAVSAWLVLLLILRSENPARRLLELPVVRSAGDQSYSVYVLHWPLLTGVVALFGSRVHGPELVALCLAACVIVLPILTYMVHHYVERPGIAWGKRLTGPRATFATATSA